MKKITLILMLTMFVGGCEIEQRNPGYMTPTRPSGVPVVNCDDDTIVWDWKYQVAYNEDRLHFHMDTARDCVTLVVMEK